MNTLFVQVYMCACWLMQRCVIPMPQLSCKQASYHVHPKWIKVSSIFNSVCLRLSLSMRTLACVHRCCLMMCVCGGGGQFCRYT